MTRDWVCYPCSEFVPERSGKITVHGMDKDTFVVWCPWCGDKMEPVE